MTGDRAASVAGGNHKGDGMSRQRRTLTAAITAVTLICTMAACSDDDDGDGGAATTAAESDAAADEGGADDGSENGSESDSDGGAGSNAEVEAYCTAVDELAEAAQQLIDDPANADPTVVSELTQELTEQATQLAGSVGPEDAARLQECSDRFSEIGS